MIPYFTPLHHNLTCYNLSPAALLDRFVQHHVPQSRIKADDISQRTLQINAESRVFIKGLTVLSSWLECWIPVTPSLPVEIGVQIGFCFSWPSALQRSSRLGRPWDPETVSVASRHKEFTVFLLCFLNHEMHLGSALWEEKNNRDCDFLWSELAAARK